MSFCFQQPIEPELQRLSRVKQPMRKEIPALGPEILAFFKQNVQKRQTKFAPIAESWQQLIPEILLEHTALESFARGQLTVLVDSSSHLYELNQLLLAGLRKQLLMACKGAGLRKITLKPGRWYDTGEDPNDRKIRF
ncbi:MAG: DUF721 domain-containing protein [Anaerolineae bacterium]|nr:DUF721 domain-containing protein [Phycisphaerae bacterium]